MNLSFKNKLSVFTYILLFVFSTTISFSNIQAAQGVPTVLSYQGKLTDSGGNPLGGGGTNYYFKFSIWDNPTPGSGTKLWPSTSPTATQLIVRQGTFSVDIGDDTYPDALNYNFNTNSKIYLQVEVSGDGITYETLAPRSAISSSAFSQVANSINGTADSSFGTTTPFANTLISALSTAVNKAVMTIKGAVGQVANLFNILDSNNNSLFTVTAGGNVGVGTSTPGSKFTLGSGQFAGPDGSATAPTYSFSSSSGTGMYLSNTNQLNFSTGGSLRWYIASGGTLSSNGAVISLANGTAGQPALLFGSGPDSGIYRNGGSSNIQFSTAGTNRMSIASDGNVGIGTTTPVQKLDVNGNINIPSSSSTAGALYQNNSRLLHTYGTSNIFLGGNSGNFTLTGGYNVGVGEDALKSLTSGQFNLAFGRNSLSALQNGGNNVALGNSALASITSQAGNTSIGDASMFSTYGNNNVAIGKDAGRNIASASNNTYIGYNSGYNGTTGLTNATAIGYMSQVGSSNSLVLGGTGSYAVNVGVGTTTPSAKLEVYSAGDALRIGDSTGANTYINFASSRGFIGYNGSTFNTVVQAAATKGIEFNVNNNSFGSGQAMVITSAGNIGIGTTTPGSVLTIGSGQIETPFGSATLPSYSFTNDLNTGIYNIASDVLGFSTGGTERFRIYNGAVESTGQFRGLGNSAAVPAFVGSNDTNTGVFMPGSDVLGFSTGGSERMRLDSNGYLAIGTTSASQLLQVGGTYGNISVPSGKNILIADGDYGVGGNAGLVLTSGRGNNGIISMWRMSATTTSSGASLANDLIFSTVEQGTAIQAEKIRFTKDGRVGIGISNPTKNLQVSGASSTIEISSTDNTTGPILSMTKTGHSGFTISNTSVGGGVIFNAGSGNTDYQHYQFQTGGTTRLFINGTSGNVGIGTVSPGQLLHISGAGARLRLQNTSGDPVFEFQGPSGTAYLFTRTNEWYMRTDSPTKHLFFQAGDAAGQQGYVRIGSGSLSGTPTAPTSQLTLRGNTNSSTFGLLDVQSYFGTTTLFVRNDGNVGIGTSTPEFPLDVYSTVSSNQTYGYLNSSGLVGTSAGTNSYSIRAQGRILAQEFNAVSDARLKDVQFDIGSNIALDAVNKLKPVSFTWKGNQTGQPVLGFLAQDVETVIPNAVSRVKGILFDDQRTLDYNQITAILVGAVQELSKKVTGFAKEFRTEKLCVGDTCITESQLKVLLQNQGVTYTVPTPTVVSDSENTNATTTEVTSTSTGAVVSDTTSETVVPDSTVITESSIQESTNIVTE